MMPRISVLMPVYNGERYVRKAIDSILSQSFRDFEFIIIDDGSTDRTSQILAAAAMRDLRVRIISHENRGISPSLNAGLAVARGELIARMDADDVSLPDRFALQVAYLDAHRDCALVGGQIMFTDPADWPLTTMQHPLDHDGVVATMMAGSESLSHPTVMFRRDIALEIGGYSLRFEHAEDIDFFLRMGERGKLANLPDLVLHYRQHHKSIGYTYAQEQAAAHSRAIREAADRTGAPRPEPVRVGVSIGTRDVINERWAWWALRDGHLPTARLYAWRVLKRRPLATGSWRLAACAVRGR